MAHRRATIKDVALRTGVSVATVSKVINGRYGVSRDTFARVKAVIEELGYESSLVAQSLRSHRTNVIGILVSDLEPFSTEVLKGAADAIRGTGYELVIYSAGGLARDHSGWERRYLSRISGTLADGAILVTPSVVDLTTSVPVVAVDPHAGSTDLPAVHSDNLKGAITATEYLIRLGHRRIGFLGGRTGLESARQREEGYRQALAAAGITFDPGLVRVGSYRPSQSHEPALQLLAARPTAIFAANDLSAIETIRAAGSVGMSVPDDLSVIGFDSIPESALVAPALTTIDQSIQRMGYEAVRLLVGLINGSPADTSRIVLPTELVVRQSCGPARPHAIA